MTTEDLNEFEKGDEEVEIVNEFNYVGKLIERGGKCEREIQGKQGMERSLMAKLTVHHER